MIAVAFAAEYLQVLTTFVMYGDASALQPAAAAAREPQQDTDGHAWTTLASSILRNINVVIWFNSPRGVEV